MEIELKEDTQFKVVLTGTNSIEHALIPITDLTLVEYPVPDFQGGEEDEL